MEPTLLALSMPPSYFIGLMSGTSLDGVDGVLARLDNTGHLNVLAHDFVPFDATFRSELLAAPSSRARTPSTPSKEVPDMRPM